MSEDKKIVFDFALISSTEMQNLVNTPMGDWDKLAPQLAKVVVEWPLEADPTNVESYEDVPFPTGLSINRALQEAIGQHVAKPKVLKRVLLEKWNMKDFSNWSVAFQTGDWSGLDELIAKVNKEYDPAKTNGEEYLMLIGSIAAQIKDYSTQGK